MGKGDNAGLSKTTFDGILAVFFAPGQPGQLPTEADCRDLLAAVAKEEFAAQNPGTGVVGVVHVQKALDDVETAFAAVQNNMTSATITDLRNKLVALGGLHQKGVIGFLSRA